MGSTISQVCSGRQHSLAYVPSRGLVYSYGLGGAGQLGLRKSGNASSPQVVLGPWVSLSGNKLVSNNSKDVIVIKSIFAGGDQCVALVTDKKCNTAPSDYRNYSSDSQILTLTSVLLTSCSEIDNDTAVDQDLMKELEVVFRSSACLNGSFLKKNNEHFNCCKLNHGVDVDDARKGFLMIASFKNTTLKDLVSFNLQIKKDLTRNLRGSFIWKHQGKL